jgi:hypothetical protein
VAIQIEFGITPGITGPSVSTFTKEDFEGIDCLDKHSTKILNWCTKCLSTVEDITTVDGELPHTDTV